MLGPAEEYAETVTPRRFSNRGEPSPVGRGQGEG